MRYNSGMKIILASASPRRKELLGKITTNFSVIVSGEDEKGVKAPPESLCQALAKQKAGAVAKQNYDSVVIGADTIVVFNDKILGKPSTTEENIEFLKTLSGNAHYVLTGFAVYYKGELYSGVEKTKVVFRHLTDTEILDYCYNGGGLDKAGGYGIQDGDFVKEIVGDYDNVVGFPTARIEKILKKICGDKL